MLFRSHRRALAPLLGLLLLIPLVVVVPTAAQAAPVSHDRVVNPDPVNWTPHALDNSVRTLAQTGNTVIAGGNFTRIASSDSSVTYNQGRLFSYNATTGAINTNFLPQITGGDVESVVVHPDGDKVWVGGDFSTVNGVNWPKLALLRLSDGSLVTSFVKSAIDGKVRDMALVGPRLIVAGTFTKYQGVAQPRLAAVAVSNGKYVPFVTAQFAGMNNGGTSAVTKIDVSDDGSRLVAIGNFTSVNSQPRLQLAVLDLTGPTATLAHWATPRFSNVCSKSFDTYMRDVDIDPQGLYFAIATTGAYKAGQMCDSASRFELRATGTNIQPTWIDYTGGDTLWSVAATGAAVYVGGHQRWANNSSRADAAGPGAVGREGLAALDPINGLPLSWNPGRDRGVGVFAMVPTDNGLLIGSDTDRLGRYEYHGRIGYFPLQGGAAVPRSVVGSLPGRLLSLGTGTNAFVARNYDGTTFGSAQTLAGTATNARAATMISSELYQARSNGNFEVAAWDGTTLRAASVVPDLANTTWRNDVAAMTSLYFSNGRLYYTLNGNSNLYYRYFTPESQVVGSDRFIASASVTGLNYATVRSAVMTGNVLYWVESTTGNLRKTTVVAGVPQANATTTVSGPAVNGIDWRQGPLVLEALANGPAPNTKPIAVAQPICTGLSCTFSSAGSGDPDGQLISIAWDFGDGATASGANAEHTFASEGPFQVTLTVTDNGGATTSSVLQLAPDALPTASFQVDCPGLTCSFDGRGSADGAGPVANYEWNFGDGDTATGAQPNHTFAPGSQTVSLKVTDNEGNVATVSRTFAVAAPADGVVFADAAKATANGTAINVPVPNGTVAGDGMVLVVSGNRADVDYGAPAGWTEVGRTTDTDLTTIVWQRVADGSDAGSQARATASLTTKLDAQLFVYRGTPASGPVVDATFGVEALNQAQHTSPSIDASEGDVLLTYWADKSSATTTWTAPQDTQVRGTSIGVGSGRVTSLAVESGPFGGTGPRGGLVATADSASAKATMVSLLLAPAH